MINRPTFEMRRCHGRLVAPPWQSLGAREFTQTQ